MNSKEFTLREGFGLPILKALSIMAVPGSLDDICNCLISNSVFNPCEGDLEKIDFNEKTRFKNSVESKILDLINKGLVVASNNLFSISEEGSNKINTDWSTYNQNDYIKKVEIDNKNKYIYSNIPSYLLYTGHPQVYVTGFEGYETQYFKFLNDFIDYIDLNYPTMDEMIKFLKTNYSFNDNNLCLDTINVIRSCGLGKVIGKNISLTKLGQWYINSYSSIALFKVFANRYSGFEEIFKTISLNNNISIDILKSKLQSEYGFDWVNETQFYIRLNWLKAMELLNEENNNLILSNDSLLLAEYLGFIDINVEPDNSKVITPNYIRINTHSDPTKSPVKKVSQDDFDFSYELDNIVDDLISESVFEDEVPVFSKEMVSSKANDNLFFDDNLDISGDIIQDAKSNSDFIPKPVNLSTQERSFLLSNDIENQLSFEFIGSTVDDSESQKEIPALDFEIDTIDQKNETDLSKVQENVEVEVSLDDEFIPLHDTDSVKHCPVIIKMPTKNIVQEEIPTVVKDDDLDFEMYISPNEISKYINLPNDIILKIASALNMNKHIILTGPHGSGKTSIAVALAKLAQQKSLCSGYTLVSANEYWSSLDTIGGMVESENEHKKFFKEGFLLKSIRENKWLLVDEINKCDTNKCFNGFINAFYGYNTVLSHMHENHKNIEIISDPSNNTYEINQYIKSNEWRMIATMDVSEKYDMNFSSSLIRRFAFIDISVNSYGKTIDEYFEKNDLHNDLLKSKIKIIFSDAGLLKYNDIGTSSIYDLIEYISIRSKMMYNNENVQDILAEGLELYILPQLRILDDKIVKEAQSYLIELFDGYEKIKTYISKAL